MADQHDQDTAGMPPEVHAMLRQSLEAAGWEQLSSVMLPKITINVRANDGTGRTWSIQRVPIALYARLWRAAATSNSWDLFEVAYFGALVVGGNSKGNSGLDFSRLDAWPMLIDRIKRYKVKEKWQTDIDPILSFCYHALYHRLINREQAAGIAEVLLQEEIDVEAWRMRVNRWYTDKRRNLPKIKRGKLATSVDISEHDERKHVRNSK